METQDEKLNAIAAKAAPASPSAIYVSLSSEQINYMSIHLSKQDMPTKVCQICNRPFT